MDSNPIFGARCTPDAKGTLLFSVELIASVTDALTVFVHTSATLLAEGEGAPQQLSPLQQILGNPLTLMAGLFFLFYFIVLAPEKKRKAEEAALLAALQKNDRVVTIGGICGTVVSAPADSKYVVLRIDENGNTRVKIRRSAIAQKITDDDESSDKES